LPTSPYAADARVVMVAITRAGRQYRRAMRRAASGMRGTFFNSDTSLSIGVLFTLMIVGLAQTLPRALTDGLQAHGVSQAVASSIGHQPPVGSLFAAFLGYNPLGTALGALPASATKGADLGTLTNKEYFPQLISGPFHHGLVIVLMLAILMSLVGAAASLFRGPRYIHAEPGAGTLPTDVGNAASSIHPPAA
jgi:hypothetical protein